MHGATYFVYQRALSDRIFNPISSKLFIEIEIITQELEYSNSEAAVIFATWQLTSDPEVDVPRSQLPSARSLTIG